MFFIGRSVLLFVSSQTHVHLVYQCVYFIEKHVMRLGCQCVLHRQTFDTPRLSMCIELKHS